MNNRLVAREPAVCDPVLAERIADELHCPAMIARAVIRRGAASTEEAMRFLYPDKSQLLDPYLLPDMKPAAERVLAAVSSGESVCVFGDYDADGVCSTAMLVKRLRALNANVSYYIPNRHSEGYGMSADAVRRLKKQGVSLIVTVDNGVSAFDEIALCGSLGIDVVVTDHHSVGRTIPECAAVVAASRKDASYPNRYLCGAGVALKLIQAICGGSYSEEELALAALATIADVVPLAGENRAIAALGMRSIRSISGIDALLNAAGFSQPRIDENTVSFLIAPRLNAAGRMANAMDAVRLLLGEDEQEADGIARALNDYNQQRRDSESEILEEAERQIAEAAAGVRALILAHESWNPGVIGIVASRLCERYHLPVILFSEQNGIMTGSGRSIEGVDLFENLSAFSHMFIRYGGHARAAGVTISKDRFDDFRTLLLAQMEKNYDPEDFYPSFTYDESVSLGELTVENVRQLRSLAPYGEGNSEPVFRVNGIRFASIRTIGKEDRHFCASVVQGDRVMRLVAFGKSDLLEPLHSASDWDLLAKPSINDYRGVEAVELVWVCANASEEKVAFFNAFFEQRLYNGDCSDDDVSRWYFSYPRCDAALLTYDDMRKYYRTLQTALGETGVALRSLIRSLRHEELVALCVFSQLSFFTYDADAGAVTQSGGCPTRTLEESSLYRLATKTQEA